MKFTRRIRVAIASLLVLIVIFLLYQFRNALSPLLLALFLAYVLSPVVDWMSSKRLAGIKLPRGLSVIIIYIIFFGGVSFGGTYFVINLANEMQALVVDIPDIGKKVTEEWVPTVSEKVEKVTAILPSLKKTNKEISVVKDNYNYNDSFSVKETDDPMTKFLSRTRFEIRQGTKGFEIIPHPRSNTAKEEVDQEFDFTKMVNNLIKDLIENLQSIIVETLNWGQMALFGLVNSIVTMVVTLMLSAFVVIDSDRIVDYFRSLLPKQLHKGYESFLEKLDTGLNGVVRGQIIICLVNGTLTGIGLMLLDIKFALTLSILAAVCSLIPIFGVAISSIPIMLMALTDSFFLALLSFAWIMLIHFIEGNFLNPKIIGKSAEIHPVLVIIALVAGEKTYGLLGALLAVPFFSILQTTYLFTMDKIFNEDLEILTATDVKKNKIG